jgi:sensor histidine kinase YesM
MKKWVLISVHLVIWLIVYVLPFFIVRQSEGKELEFAIRWSINTGFNVGMFYFYYLYFTPTFLKKGQIFTYIIGIFGSGIIFVLFRTVFTITVLNQKTLSISDREFGTSLVVFSFTEIMIFGLSLFFNLIGFWFKNQEVKSEMEKQQMRSELDIMRYKVNPHFLFNTLNNIYTLVYKKSDKAPQAMLKLSNIMRYMLKDNQEGKVDLLQEADYLQNFIDLQRLRLQEWHKVSFEMRGDMEGKMIESMLLIPFVENAFKHGVGGREQCYIIFKLKFDEEYLFFYAENPILKREVQKDQQSGIGLENVRKRLELLYFNKYDLKIEKNEHKYSVTLKLQL